jgi:hypothetical protein
MRTGNVMGDSHAGKEGTKSLIFPTPISLYSTDFSIKLSLNKHLKITKTLKNFRLSTQQIDPCEFTMVINETHIVIISTN